MSNYTLKIDYKKMNGKRLAVNLGNEGVVEGIFIPLKENDIYVSVDNSGNDKAYYQTFNAWENKNPLHDDKSGQTLTHGIKPSKRDYKNLTDEQKNAIPFVGNLITFSREPGAAVVADVASVAPASTEPPSGDGLPF